jgi:hypothetical protein
MTQNGWTHYDVLGVPRNAKASDIGRAYNRIRAEQRKETTVPDARLLGLAKAAYDTLSDPDLREEYDRALARRRLSAQHRKGVIVATSLAVVLASGAGYYFASRPEAPSAEETMEPAELLAAVSPQVGRVQIALMSGEVRELGTAVAVGANEMITTCSGMMPGAQLFVKVGENSTKAEMGKATQDLDVCTLSVKDTEGHIRVRTGLPAASEKLHAVFLGPAGKPLLRPASVVRLIDDPQGDIIEIRADMPLPNGTPVFDAHARLAAMVTTSQSSGNGLIVALPGARIVQGRGGVFGAFAPAQEPDPPPKSRAVTSPPTKGDPDVPSSRVSVEDLRSQAVEKAVRESEASAK